MKFAPDIRALFLGLLTLAFLSIYTLIRCKEEVKKLRTSIHDPLFLGARSIDSLASAMGSAFSLTYFGAVVIYSALSGLLFLPFLVMTLACSAALIHRVTVRAHARGLDRRHALFGLITREYSTRNATIILCLYLAIFAALLVEELAVSRVVLSLIFPQAPFLYALILATILLVSGGYIAWGGYRAVLVSDHEQAKVLVPFLLVLGITIVAEERTKSPANAFTWSEIRMDSVPALALGSILFVAWLSASPDFYARLNFLRNGAAKAATLADHRSYIALAMLLLLLVYGTAALAGLAMPASFAALESPSAYTRFGIEIAFGRGSTAASAIFLASIFCMIFTTIDTILITLLQIGRFLGLHFATNRALSAIITAGALFSAVVPAEGVSAFGIFVASLVLVPFMALLGVISSRIRSILPAGQEYLFVALLLSVVAFFLVYPHVETSYSRHPWLALLVLASLMLCGIIFKAFEIRRRR